MFVYLPLVSPNLRVVLYTMNTNYDRSIVTCCERIRTLRLPDKHGSRAPRMTPHRGEVDVLPSNVHPRRPIFQCMVTSRSPGHIERGRAVTPGHRSAVGGVGQLFAEPICRHVRFDGEGNGAIAGYMLRAIDTTLGWLGQKLDRIGATGDMVLRLGEP